MHIRFMGQSGITLAELMVVVGIIAIMSAIGIPLFLERIPHLSVRGSSRDLVSDLRVTQGLAVKQSTAYQIVFDVNAETYDIQCVGGSPPGSIPPCSADPLPPLKELGDQGRSSIDLVSVRDSTDADLGLIRYRGDGAVIVPNLNFPITIRLESEETNEPMEVQISRGGRLQSIVP